MPDGVQLHPFIIPHRIIFTQIRDEILPGVMIVVNAYCKGDGGILHHIDPDMMMGKNPEDLAEALLKLINGKAEREQMAHRAHEMSLAILNWDNIIKTLQAEIISRLNK